MVPLRPTVQVASARCSLGRIGGLLRVLGLLLRGGLYLAKLGLVVRAAALRVGKARTDEEAQVDNGQDPAKRKLATVRYGSCTEQESNVPDNSTERCAGGQSSTLPLPPSIILAIGAQSVVEREQCGGVAGRPSPGREPKDEREGIGDESNDAVEEMRCPDLDGYRTAVDDKRLDGDENEQTARAASVVAHISAEQRDRVGGQRENDEREDQDGDLDEEQEPRLGRYALLQEAAHIGESLRSVEVEVD